jgi:hypothetical protein
MQLEDYAGTRVEITLRTTNFQEAIDFMCRLKLEPSAKVDVPLAHWQLFGRELYTKLKHGEARAFRGTDAAKLSESSQGALARLMNHLGISSSNILRKLKQPVVSYIAPLDAAAFIERLATIEELFNSLKFRKVFCIVKKKKKIL